MGNKVKKIKNNILRNSLVKFPDPVLFEQCKDVDDFESDSFKEILKNLKKVNFAERGLGVAGPQIGVLKNIFYYNIRGEQGYVINPILKSFSKDKVSYNEGCLSIRGYYWDVVRPEWVTVSWQDEHGEFKFAKVSGIHGRLFQHEMDHLNGILLTHYLSDEEYDKFEESFFVKNKVGQYGPMIIDTTLKTVV
jgi:peptide deformylase